jgi:hypothetical protein
MGVRAIRQLVVIAVALSLWSFAPRPAFWALCVAYVAAVLLLSALDAGRFIGRVPRAAGLVLLAIVLGAGGLGVARAWGAFVEYEGLGGLAERVGDRVRVEMLPAIAPRLVVADRPQTFFVQAQAGEEVSVRFGARGKLLRAREVGGGLFRVEYDPKRDGAPSPADGPLPVEIACGGRRSERTLLAATPLAHPRWLAASPDRARAAAVSEETDELVLVSARGEVRRVGVGDGPTDALFVDAAHVAVAHRDEPALWIVDVRGTGAGPRRVEIGTRQARLALSPSGQRLAVGRGGRAPELVLLDVASAGVAARVALPAAPDWLAFGADDATLIAATRADATLHEFRDAGGTWREIAALPLGRPAVTLARAHDGARLFVAVTDYEPDGRAHLGNHFIQDQILTVDTSPLRVAHSLLTARRSPRQSKPGDVDRGASPLGIAQARDGALLVAFAGTDEVWRIDASTAEPEMIDVGDAGLYAPHGIAELAGGTLLVSSPATGSLGLFARDAAAPRVVHLAPSDGALLAHNPTALERRLGERDFYEATRAGISCQSCHLHADSDERAHNLGDHRLLPTLSVRGMTGTAPYLRDGSYPRLSDLDHVARMLYRGYLRKTPGRAETMAAFVAALPRRETSSGASGDLARVQRGLRVFERAGCPSCHAPPLFSGLGQHLAAGLFPERAAQLPRDELLDAPSLLSVAAGAPYLSDGRARTLDAVLSQHNRDNRHGDTARLSRDERADLVAFLESL